MASFSVLNNIASVNAQANLTGTQINLSKALTRLSSGLRINMSGDDAAGLAVANSYRADIAVLNQGIRNAGDGLSTLQIKDGALNNISTLIDRLATLATQSASSSATVNRTALDLEFQDVLAEIDREAAVAGVTAAGTAANAATAVAALQTAVGTLGSVQAQVGTLENRLQYAISLASSQVVNNTAAESRIRDANVAQESSNLTKYNILTQSGIAALAQANSSTGAVLALLR